MSIKTLFEKENLETNINLENLGLTSSEAEESRRKYGKNILPRARRESFFKKF